MATSATVSTAPAGAAADASVPRCVVAVAGSEAEGADVLAGVLTRLGLLAPRPEVAREPGRRPGEGGPQWVADFHARLAQRANVQADEARPAAFFDAGRVAMNEAHRKALTAWLAEQFADGEQVVVRDSRVLWFLAAWRVAAVRTDADLSTVAMLRHPAAVLAAGSRAADRTADVGRLAGWLNAHLAGERATRGSRRAFVSFDALVADWTNEVVQLGQRLEVETIGLAGVNRISDVHLFLPTEPPSEVPTWDGLAVPADLRELADRTWVALLGLAAPGEEDPALLAELDAVRRAYADTYAAAEALAASSIAAAGPADQRAHPPQAAESASRRAYRKVRRAAGRAKRWMRRES